MLELLINVSCNIQYVFEQKCCVSVLDFREMFICNKNTKHSNIKMVRNCRRIFCFKETYMNDSLELQSVYKKFFVCENIHSYSLL